MIGFVVLAVLSQAVSQPYRWKSVQMVGGGFVDGIVFHPKAAGVVYARTDIGGSYRWDGRRHKWEPLQDWVAYEDTNLMGVESIGLDPNDPTRVYLACGMYTNRTSPNAAILRSTDGGRSFQRSDLPFKMGGNENGRGNGERLAVSGKVLFFGSRGDGLWKSTDYGVSWKSVPGFPSLPTNGVGIVSVLFDRQVVYAAASVAGQSSLFESGDGGDSWQAVPNQPTVDRPTRMKLGGDGTLFVTYGSSAGPSGMRSGSVWKLDTGSGKWTDITPDRPTETRRFGYAAVSVEARDPKVLIVSTFGHPDGEEIYRSTDGGVSWKPVFHAGGATYDFSKAPYVSKTPIHWLFDVEIDPANPDHALFTTGYGGYETFDLSDVDRSKPTKWSVMSTGIEETVLLEMVSPPAGVHLVTAIGDYGGFVHWNLDKPSPEGNFGNPTFGNTTGVAVAWLKPSVMVRVGTAAGRGTVNFGYSLDGGKRWQPPKSIVSGRGGTIAVAADGSTWIWTAGRGVPSYTRDESATWTACVGLPAGARVIADRVNPHKFYALDLFGGSLYESEDGGASFATVPLSLPGGLPKRGGNRGDERGGQDRLYATPGVAGDLWIAAFDGLYHSARGGFEKVAGVTEMEAFGFGKAAPGAHFPALFMFGVVDGVRGVFRSDDVGGSWVRINDDEHRWGLILQVSGDPRIYGRVYVGTHGRGVLYGDPERQ